MPCQRLDGALRQDQGAFRLRRLGVAAATRRAPHVDHAVGEVHVIPSEFAQFAWAQAKGDGEHEQRFEPHVRVSVLVEAELGAA